MSKTISVDSLSLSDLYVIQIGGGQYLVRAVFSLLSGSQVVLTLNQDVSATMNTNATSAITTAFGTVETAIAAQVATL